MRHRKNFWCRLNLHYWSYPGGRCIQCGQIDYLWEAPPERVRPR